jgi:GT2 family glycosyltransferase
VPPVVRVLFTPYLSIVRLQWDMIGGQFPLTSNGPLSPYDSNAQHVVTAIIVAHDGAAWLPELAGALRDQTRPVNRVVAVDTGSRDRSGMLLTSLFGSGVVFGADRATGFGTAVAQALRHRAANTPVHPAHHQAGQWPGEEAVEWIWLLHDDCAPEPDALQCLLDAATATQGTAVAGPKVRDWEDPRIVVEAGLAIDGAGRRETGAEQGELDQGQHDGERDVLAVSSVGMLVRKDVWDRLGGFDRSLPMFRDDLDFCWRVNSAGYRVRLVTKAVVHHVEASSRGLRTISAGDAPAGGPRRMDRRNALFVLFTNLPLRPMLTAVFRNVAGSLLRTLVLLAGKHPRAALDEITALWSILSDPVRLLRGRRRRAPGRRSAYPFVRSLIPRGQTVGRITEIIGSAWVGSGQPQHALSDDDEEALLTDTGFAQRVLTNPGVLTVILLTVIALVAERSLLHGGRLGGGALLPVSGGSADLWREYFASFHDAGIGSTAYAPPYVAVLAFLSTAAGGKPWLAVDIVLLGCVPLAGLTAYLASRRITGNTYARVWVGFSYALLPVAAGTVAQGRVGTAVAFVMVPVIGILVGRMLTEPSRRGRQYAWAAGLLVAIVAAFVPLVWALSVATAVVAAAVLARTRRRTAINFAIVALVPAVLLIPWTFDLVTHPAMFLSEAGLPPRGGASAALAPSSLFLLSPGGQGLPPVWVTAGFGFAGLVALLLNKRRAVVAAGWGIALSGLLAAIAMSRVKVTPPGGGPAGPSWPGVALILAAAGVLIAAVPAAESLPAMLRRGRGRRALGVAAALIACSAPALVAGAWVAEGVGGQVKGTFASALPEFVTASSANGMRTRTLLLRSRPAPIRYAVLRNADPLLGEAELTQPVTAQRQLAAVVAGLASGNGGNLGDDGGALARFAIGYVLLPAPMDPGLIRVLDGTPGLRPVSLTGSFGLWQVTQTAARVRVIEPGGAVVPVRSGRVEVGGAKVPAAGGTLVLAEPAGGWQASLNGRALTPLASPVDGWAQGFRLPPGGGRLDISRATFPRQAVLGLEAAALVAVVILALPSTRTETVTADEEQAAEETRGRSRRRQAKPQPGRSRRSRRGARRAPRARPAVAGRGERPSAPSWAPPSAAALRGPGAPEGPLAPPGMGDPPGMGPPPVRGSLGVGSPGVGAPGGGPPQPASVDQQDGPRSRGHVPAGAHRPDAGPEPGDPPWIPVGYPPESGRRPRPAPDTRELRR